MTRTRVGILLLLTYISVVTSVTYTAAQSLPAIPEDFRFADVSVYLSGAARYQLQREIYTLYTNRPLVEQTMDALRQLTPLWQSDFQTARLPLDFRYATLPFPGADTTASYWSVSPQQAVLSGLRMDSSVDERMHPTVSTEKIVKYLSRLRQTYPENALRTLLRYVKANVQPGSITNPPDSSNVAAIWLDVDSPPLIWKILARKIVVEYEEPTYRPFPYYMVYPYQNGGGQTLRNIARRLKLPDERLLSYNKWLKTASVPLATNDPVLIRLKPDEFPAVRRADERPALPVDTGFPVLRKLPTQASGLRSTAIFYTINERLGIQAQPCDNIVTLAYYGKVAIPVFLAYNELTEQDVVRLGQIYYLERKAKRAKVPFHVMQRYQSLRDLSNIYGVRLSSLLRFNRVEPTQRIGAGRIIWMQKKRPRHYPIKYRQLAPEEPVPLPIPDPVLVQVDSSRIDSSRVSALVDTTHQVVLLPAVVQPETAPVQPVTPPKVPTPKPVEVVTKEPTPIEPNKITEPAKIHVVKAGQTYYAISRLYGVTPNQLYAWNGLSERIPLQIGQELIVKPARTLTNVSRPTVPTTTPPPVTVRPSQVSYYHTVKPGQTVYRVALINKVTVEDVMKWNNLKDYTIEIGQKLLIRKPKP